MARQRRRERAVGAFAVKRHLSGLGCERDQRPRAKRCAGAQRRRRCQSRSGFDGPVRSGGGELLRRRIVAAGVEDQNVGANLVVEARKNRVHIRHCFGDVAAGLQLRIHRHEVVAAVDLTRAGALLTLRGYPRWADDGRTAALSAAAHQPGPSDSR
jgi:hypothetical protein